MKNAIIKKTVIVALIAVMVGALALGLCACNKNNDTPYYHFDETLHLSVNESKTVVMDMESIMGVKLMPLLFNMVFDREKSYAEFRPDGTMHFQLQTREGLFGNVTSLLTMIQGFGFDFDVEEMLASVELAGMLHDYVEPMFPGFTAKIRNGDLGGALNLAATSLGLNIVGLDYSNDDVKGILKEIAESETMSLPSDLLDRIPEDTVLTLTMDETYYVWDVKGHDGKTYTAVAIGELGKTNYTDPWCVFNMTTNEDGSVELIFTAEFMASTLAFIKNVEQAET